MERDRTRRYAEHTLHFQHVPEEDQGDVAAITRTLFEYYKAFFSYIIAL